LDAVFYLHSAICTGFIIVGGVGIECMPQCDGDDERSGITGFSVTGVTWESPDGTTYRRIIQDGEIVDREVSSGS
jgi:hypothetical protein